MTSEDVRTASLRGLATINFWAGDVLGVMDNPHYVEVRSAAKPA
jgi:hypothetical protein